MKTEIRPLESDDLEELGRFLVEGFRAAPDADFGAPEVLRWKYLDDLGLGGEPLSYLACDESGRIVGHLGLCRTEFDGRALEAASPGGRVGTIHIIDWLGSASHRAIGMSLMRRAHQGVPTQFGLGVSPSALVVGERAGYELRAMVPAFARTLRAGYWLRAGDDPRWRRSIRLARDLATRWIRPPARPGSGFAIEARPVDRFGEEIVPIVASAREHAILTARSLDRLNRFLAFPRQDVTGWHLVDASGRLRGFAILNVIPGDGGRTRIGKVVDALLDGIDVDAWHAAFLALARVLTDRGADLALAYGSTPWTAEALRRAGFVSRYAVKFHIRDREGLIPRGPEFHLTPIEGDYGYT